MASDDARFATSGINFGLFCATPAVPVARNIAVKRAFEMLLTGEFIDAPTALAWGLVNRVVPAAELDAAVAALAATIVEKPPEVIAAGKAFFYRQLAVPVETAYALARRTSPPTCWARPRRKGSAPSSPSASRAGTSDGDAPARTPGARAVACSPQAAVALALALLASPAGALDLDVVGLFAGKAVVVIDGGAPRTLSAGQKTAEGVRLLRADSSSAEFEIEGRRQVLGLGRGRYGGGPATGSAMATLYADTSGHFVSDGSINGSTVRFLVDTGATTVALNGREAARIGLDYRRGERISMSTANGVVSAFSIAPRYGARRRIELHNVEAVVHEGDHPSIVLIGMSFLNQVDMKRDGSLMTLTRRF